MGQEVRHGEVGGDTDDDAQMYRPLASRTYSNGTMRYDGPGCFSYGQNTRCHRNPFVAALSEATTYTSRY